jgi:dimethylhistidine N-methyltransferase
MLQIPNGQDPGIRRSIAGRLLRASAALPGRRDTIDASGPGRTVLAYLPQLRSSVRAGLTSSPKSLPARYLLDARGRELAEQIAGRPEYYRCRAEASIMAERATQIAAGTGCQTLVQLGSSPLSPATRLLLDALAAARTLRELVLFDLDPAALAAGATALAGEYPSLTITPVTGDLEADLAGAAGSGGRMLFSMTESAAGTLEPSARSSFLRRLRAVLRPDDFFLLSADLVREPARLQRAYNDEGGLAAELSRNALTVLNRELGADFSVQAYQYEAAWVPGQEQLEMRLRATSDQAVTIAGADLIVHFRAGDTIRTGIAAKFRPGRLIAELARAGLRMQRLWTDAERDYCLSLSQPAG